MSKNILWRYELQYTTPNGVTCYMASFVLKNELADAVKEYRRAHPTQHRPLLPAEPWVFDVVRNRMQEGKSIKKLRIFIRDKKEYKKEVQ